MDQRTSRRGFRLIACGHDGRLSESVEHLPAAILDACAATAAFYDRVGFHPPWTGYVALDGDRAVGGGAFVGPPRNGRIEIAYFTLPEFQARGYATRTAERLVAIARKAGPGLHIYAKTLPSWGPSTAILTGLGFRRIGTDLDHEIGEAWAWLLE